jgi:fluoride exporter
MEFALNRPRWADDSYQHQVGVVSFPPLPLDFKHRHGGFMGRILLIGIGGLVGTLLRYGIGGALARVKVGASFPYETLVINVTGCLAIGALAGLAESRGILSGTTRAAIFIGLLGGYTTFSTFGYETFQLVRGGQTVTAAASVALQVVLGVSAVWAGDAGVRVLWGR